MKNLITFSFLLMVFAVAPEADAAKLEQKDFLGTLTFVQQETGEMGSIEVRATTKQDNVIGDLVAELNMTGLKQTAVCAGDFYEPEQELILRCENNRNILTVKVEGSNKNLSYYLAGSLATATIKYEERSLNGQKTELSVDIRNHNMR